MDHFILRGHEAVPATTREWADWYGSASRVVRQETVRGADVSTVFLGLDHAWGGGPPLVFETMIFGGPHDQYTQRYTTWEQAERGHARAVRLVEATAWHRVALTYIERWAVPVMVYVRYAWHRVSRPFTGERL